MTDVKPIQVFRTSTTVDDRGSRGATIGYFRKKDEADIAAKDQGYWGGKGKVEPVHVLHMDGDLFYVLDQEKPVQLDVNMPALLAAAREKALAKLTDEDRRLLGL